MVHSCEHSVSIADVGDESGCFTADLADLGGDGLDRVHVDIDESDVMTVVREAKRNTSADSLSASGDESDAHDCPFEGSTSTFIFVPACNASKPSSITDSRVILSTQPVVSYLPCDINSITDS